MTGGPVSGKQRGRFGFFSFFTGAGFFDLGFEDAGFAAEKSRNVA
jgi:site-specific DNA-cytosine methylase